MGGAVELDSPLGISGGSITVFPALGQQVNGPEITALGGLAEPFECLVVVFLCSDPLIITEA